MKNKIFAASLLAVVAGSLTSCELEEYNPGAGTGGDLLSTYDGLYGLETYCYEPIYSKLFSAFDYLCLAECGTDLFVTGHNATWGQQIFYYEGLTTNTTYSNNIFLQAYSLINTCNAVIEEAEDCIDDTSGNVKVLVAEAKTLRAFYYLILTTHYGNITMKTTSSATSTNTTPKRSGYEAIYGQIVKDLTEAAEDLGVEPLDGQYARVTKKTALGLLARAYAQGAGEGLTEDGVSYWKRAQAVAEDMIANADAYGLYMHETIEDLWAMGNNRDNKESLFTAAGYDGTASLGSVYGGGNNIFTYAYPDPNKLSDIYPCASKANYYIGRANNNVMAPTKYLIDLFDNDVDARFNNSFTCAFGLYSMVQPGWVAYKTYQVVWDSTKCITYGKDMDVVLGDTIFPYVDCNYVSGTYNQYPATVWPAGDHSGNTAVLEESDNVYATPYPMDLQDDRFAIYLSKETISDEEKAKSPIVIINIDDLFDSEGKYNESAFDGTNSYQLFPGLAKMNWNYTGVFGNDLQRHNGDVMIMRTAEVYLIAAEAAQQNGDAATAAKYLNVVRKRACRNQSNFASTMQLSSATEQDVLDEFARELCGEFGRWAVLKRHKAFETQLAKGNPRALASFDASLHYNRPISYDFLSQIDNAEEYGTNGY